MSRRTPDDDDPDVLYSRAMQHAREFKGLSMDEAHDLATDLGLSLDVVAADGWHTGVNVPGVLTVFVLDGKIVGTG